MRSKTRTSEAAEARTSRPNPEIQGRHRSAAGRTGRPPCPTTGGPQQAMARCCRNCAYAARASGRWLRVLMSRWPGKWYVKIKCGDERVNLGPFDSEIEAARARDRKARELFGEFAGLNLPPGPAERSD